MNHPDKIWQRLTTLARQAPMTDSDAMPPGFATRIAARAAAQRDEARATAWEWLALRAAVGAATVLLVCWLATPTAPPQRIDLVESIFEEALHP